MGHRTNKTNHKSKVHKTIESRTDFFYYAFRNILLVTLPLTLIFALLLSLPHSSAHSSNTDSLSLTLPTSCTLSANITSAHTIEMVSGQYAGNIGNTRMSAYCNDNNGYYIYALGVSGDVDGNTDLVSNAGNNYNIHTGIYSSEGLTPATPSSWAMKLTAGTGTNTSTTVPTVLPAFTSYNTIPSISTMVAYRTSNTDTTTNTELTGSYIDTTYEIYTSPTQPAGNYLGKVKYTMVHPYDSSKLTSIEDAFDIAGKDKITVTDPTTGDTIGSYYKMQDMSTNICNLVSLYNEPSQTQLVDIRDNKLYWIAKLDDEHCWMTQNLDFDIVADAQDPTKMKILTSEDTNLTDHSLTGAYSQANGYSYDENTGITTWTPASIAKTINFTGGNNTTVTGWGNNNSLPYSASKTDDTNTGHNSLGNWYSWTAAIASNNSSSLSSDTFNNVSNNPQNSICPKGWRLPTISSDSGSTTGSTNEFARLNYLYNNDLTNTANGLLADPVFFIMAGEIDSGKYATSQLRYVSSTVKDQNKNYFLQYKPSDSVPLSLSAAWTKSSGRSVRCLAK